MTFRDFQAALLAEAALAEVGPTGSLDQARAVACCLRNRAREFGCTVMEAIQNHERPHYPAFYKPLHLSPNSLLLLNLLRDIDDLFFGGREEAAWKSQRADRADAPHGTMEESLARCLWWQFAGKPVTARFEQEILGDPEKHPLRAQVGLMMFYE